MGGRWKLGERKGERKGGRWEVEGQERSRQRSRGDIWERSREKVVTRVLLKEMDDNMYKQDLIETRYLQPRMYYLSWDFPPLASPNSCSNHAFHASGFCWVSGLSWVPGIA